MNLTTSLSLFSMAVLMINSTPGEAARKRAAHHSPTISSALYKAKPYGAGMNEEQSLHALEAEISRKLGSKVQEGDYPEEARREGWSGTTRVDVLVGSDGKIKEVSVQQSSGFPILDERAVSMVDRISLWWIPQRLRHREVMVTVPVGFYIRDALGPPLISADAVDGIVAERISIATSDCRNTNETDSGLNASPAVDLVPPLRLVHDSIAAGWTAANALR